MFQEKKAVAMAARIVANQGGSISHIKLMKLMYLAERKRLAEKGSPITGSRLVNMAKGPVLSEAYDCMKPKRNSHMPSQCGDEWRKVLSPIASETIHLKKTASVPRALTPPETEAIDSVLAEFGHFTPEQLIDYTYDLPEYEDPGDGAKWIIVEEIFSAAGLPPEVVESRLARLQYLREVDNYFARAR